MTNTKLLEKKIKESGKKKVHLCRVLGVSKPTFRKLLTGQSEFKTSQVKILCEELGISTPEERETIFFASNVA
jgi:hypothetical protein